MLAQKARMKGSGKNCQTLGGKGGERGAFHGKAGKHSSVRTDDTGLSLNLVAPLGTSASWGKCYCQSNAFLPNGPFPCKSHRNMSILGLTAM